MNLKLDKNVVSRRDVLKKMSFVAPAFVFAGTLNTNIASTTDPLPDAGSEDGIICHKGKTLDVAPEAVPAHLGHGDTVGACD